MFAWFVRPWASCIFVHFSLPQQRMTFLFWESVPYQTDIRHNSNMFESEHSHPSVTKMEIITFWRNAACQDERRTVRRINSDSMSAALGLRAYTITHTHTHGPTVTQDTKNVCVRKVYAREWYDSDFRKHKHTHTLANGDVRPLVSFSSVIVDCMYYATHFDPFRAHTAHTWFDSIFGTCTSAVHRILIG